LVTSRVMLHGKKGLCFADVCKLKRIRHLHEDTRGRGFRAAVAERLRLRRVDRSGGELLEWIVLCFE
jgi:hypothetical protein